MLSKDNRFSEGFLPAATKEKVLEVEDGIVTKKEVDGNIYLRKRCAMSGQMFWEAEGTPFYCSISSETYWCSQELKYNYSMPPKQEYIVEIYDTRFNKVLDLGPYKESKAREILRVCKDGGYLATITEKELIEQQRHDKESADQVC